MTDRPILFSAPMVRALLEGRKTQTRRVLKVEVPLSPGDDALNPRLSPRHPHAYLDAYCNELKTVANPRGMSDRWCWWTRDDRQRLPTFKVGYKPGDRLWVREAWCPANSEQGPLVCYAADHHRWQPEYDGEDFGAGPSFDYEKYPAGKGAWSIWAADLESGSSKGWRPGIHMPRWASRLTLTVTDVRVPRLQEISEADCIAEGIDRTADGWWLSPDVDTKVATLTSSPQDGYRLLWEQFNDDGAWDANPWVVALTFTVERRNIDARAA